MKKIRSKRLSEIFGGYAIIHGDISHAQRAAFILKEIPGGKKRRELGHEPGPDELGTRAVLYNFQAQWPDEKEHMVAKGWTAGVRSAYAVFSGTNKAEHLIMCGIEGSGKATMTEFPPDERWIGNRTTITKPFDNHKAMMAARNIAGEVYFAGRLRKLFKRSGPNQWVDLTDPEQHPELITDITQARARGLKPIDLPMGFHAIDGFTANDLYCGGHQGDLWHYDGQHWRRLDPPANFDIESICCAGNGQVYLAGSLGGLLKGRFDPISGDERWAAIKNAPRGSDTRFNAMAWFQDRLYLATHWGLYYLDEAEALQEYRFPEGGVQQYSFGQVTACDTALLSYGPDQALVFDGTSWEQIVGKIVVPE